MDSSNFDVVIQLFLDDIAKIESTQKGKGRAGELSDDEYAIQCMKDNLLSIKTAKDDMSVALSTLRAATTDANALAFIRKDEIIALNDHQYALALERGENPDSALPNTMKPNTMKRQQNIDTVSLGMGYLVSRIKEEDLVDNCDGLSHVGIQKKKVTCTCCLEQREDIAFSGRCGHHYCHDCTRRLISSTRSEALYPPRCCGQVLPPIVVITVLSYEELRVFSNKAIEYNTTNRVYCADPKCSQFIPDYAIDKGNATCTRCSKITHQPCLSLAHPGVRCPVNGTRREIFEMARTEKWRRCSKCKNMVELLLGCNHITCICGYQFCYVCGSVWNTCDCALWNEGRLVARVREEVENEVAPGANESVRRRAFNDIYHQLQGHEANPCEHHKSSQWIYCEIGKLKCDFCDHYERHYIFRCKNCPVRACYQCRKHRL